MEITAQHIGHYIRVLAGMLNTFVFVLDVNSANGMVQVRHMDGSTGWGFNSAFAPVTEDEELAAAIEWGLATGQLITAEDFLARLDAGAGAEDDFAEAVDEAKANLKFWAVCDEHAAGPYSTREVALRAMGGFDCISAHQIVASATQPVTRYEAMQAEQDAADEAARLAYEEWLNDEAEALHICYICGKPADVEMHSGTGHVPAYLDDNDVAYVWHDGSFCRITR